MVSFLNLISLFFVFKSPNSSIKSKSTFASVDDLTYDVKSWQAGYETCRNEACSELEGNVPIEVSFNQKFIIIDILIII